MKIIKDSICCKKKIIEKQTGGNGDVPPIDSKPPLTDSKRFFSGLDAMFLLEKFVLKREDYKFLGRWEIASNLIQNGSHQCLKCHNYIIKKENNQTKKVGYFDIYINDNGARLYELRFLKNNTDSNDFYDDCESEIKSDSYKKPDKKEIEKIFEKLTNGIIHGTYLFDDIIDKCKDEKSTNYEYVYLNNGAFFGIGNGDYGDIQDYNPDRSEKVTVDSLRNYLNAEELQNTNARLVLVFAQDITYDVNVGGIFKISKSCNDNLLFVFPKGIAIFPVTDKCTYYSDFTKT